MVVNVLLCPAYRHSRRRKFLTYYFLFTTYYFSRLSRSCRFVSIRGQRTPRPHKRHGPVADE